MGDRIEGSAGDNLGQGNFGKSNQSQSVSVNFDNDNRRRRNQEPEELTLEEKVDRLIKLIDGDPDLGYVGMRTRVRHIDTWLRVMSVALVVETIFLALLIF